jgi:GST-like protein
MTKPIDLYYWPTPNGFKVTIMLEECGLPYNLIPVNISEGDQFKPEFLKISPNNKMPAIVDHDGPDGKDISVFESGAILLYLGRKSGKFLPASERARTEVEQWLFWQMASLGPMLGQTHHFLHYAPEQVPYAINRYSNETKRLYGVLDRQLKGCAFIAGDYSVADIACFPWINSWEKQAVELADFPNVKKWFQQIGSRPAVQKGMQAGAELRKDPVDMKDPKVQAVLFGNKVAAANDACAIPVKKKTT